MWDDSMQARAEAEGWRLVTTINNGSTRPMWDVVRHGGTFRTDRDAVLAVVSAAKQGRTLHQQALRLVIQSRAQPDKKRR